MGIHEHRDKFEIFVCFQVTIETWFFTALNSTLKNELKMYPRGQIDKIHLHFNERLHGEVVTVYRNLYGRSTAEAL